MYGGVGGVHTLMFVDLYQINAYIGSDIALVRFFIFSTDSPLKIDSSFLFHSIDIFK